MTRAYGNFPLPAHAYVPGLTARHPERFLDEVKALACQTTIDETASANPAWLCGLHFIDKQFYWEAHEVLETVWMHARTNSREHYLVQGIIHLANAALKDSMERPAAAERLRQLAISNFRDAYVGLQPEILMLLSRQTVESALRYPSKIQLMPDIEVR